MCYLCDQIKVSRGVAKLDASLNNIEGIDEEIIYRDFSNTGSPYTYILKIWELNKDRLCGMFQLLRMMVNHEQQTFHIQAAQVSQVKDALHCITAMLHQPVLSFCVDPNEVIAMRILKAVKKEFSNQTGCWLHFKWPTRTVSMYGLDGDAASQFVNSIMEQLRSSLANGGPNSDGLIITEQIYDRRYKTLIKKYVGYIETQSGAQLVIKKDDPTFGQIIVQFYGIQANIQRAQEVINEEVLVRPVDEAGPCPAKACSPGEILPPEQFQNRQTQQNPRQPQKYGRQMNQQTPNQNKRQPRQQTPPQSMHSPQMLGQQPGTAAMNPFGQQQQPMAVQKQSMASSLLPFQTLQQQSQPLSAFQQPQMMSMQNQALGSMGTQSLGQMSNQSFGQMSAQSLSQMSGQSLGQMSGHSLGQMSGQSLGQMSGQSLGQMSGPLSPMSLQPQSMPMPQLQVQNTQQQQLQQMQQQMLQQELQKLQQPMQMQNTVQGLQQDQQQMVFVNVNGVPYPVVVVGPEQAPAEPQNQYSSLLFQPTPAANNQATASAENPAPNPTSTGSQCSTPRQDETDSQFDSDLQGMLGNPYSSLDRQMLLQMARMRGPKMQLFNSCSMPNLPLPKQKEPDVSADTFASLEEQEYMDLMKQTQQQMKNIYQVVNGAGVDLKWVILLLKEIVKSKLELRSVVEMLENAAALRQFDDFTVEDKDDDDE